MFLLWLLPSASLLSPPGQNLLTFFFQRSLSISCQSHYPSLGNQSASKLRQPLGTSRPWLVKNTEPRIPIHQCWFFHGSASYGGAWGWVYGVAQSWTQVKRLSSSSSSSNVADWGSSHGLGRSPGEQNGNPLQYSWLENSIGRGAWLSTVHEVANGHDWATDMHTHASFSAFYLLCRSKFLSGIVTFTWRTLIFIIV